MQNQVFERLIRPTNYLIYNLLCYVF
jgi:hypothetical protein